jgi:heme/copper-type cytochrome/quinol oxidase subunit 2
VVEVEQISTPLEQFLRFLPFIIPIILLQLTLMIIALVDLARREAVRVRGPKWLWIILIVLGELIGPIAYFIVGRKE